MVQLNLVYKYLSQFQHFSMNSESLFSHTSVMPAEYFMEILLVLACEAMKGIVGDLTSFRNEYQALGTKISEANEQDLAASPPVS